MTTRKKKPSAPAGNNEFSLISNQKLVALYAAMLRCSVFARRTGKRGAGHEAAVVGAAIDLRPLDTVSPPRGALTPCLIKGVPLKTVLTWMRTRPDALPARDALRRVIAPGADLAAQVKAALRAARLNRTSGNITVLFCDCASLTRGAGLDALRAAAAERLPVLFVCFAKSNSPDFAPRARDYGLPGITVDGDDVVAVYRVACEAIAHARRGNGPTFIECRPWAPDGAKNSEPHTGNAIRNMEEYLSRKGLFHAEHKAELMAQFELEFEKASAAAGIAPAKRRVARR